MIETGFDLVTQGGRPPVIPLESKGKITVIHRAMKKQLWIKGSMDLLNQVLKRKEKETVSISAVRGAVGRMGGRLVPKGVRPQGSSDVTEPWPRARYGAALQLLMRARVAAFETPAEAMEYFRKEVPRYLEKEHNRNNNKWDRNKGGVSVGSDANDNDNENGNNNDNNNGNDNENENNDFTDASSWPPCFQMHHLPLINWNRLIFVDEKHLRQKVGGDGALDMVWPFPEDDEGNLDVDDGKEGERPCELKMKYEKEGRYAFACVAKAADGQTKREVVLTYTGEWM